MLKERGAPLPLLPTRELAFYRRRVPETRAEVRAYPLRYGLYRHLPLALRQTVALHCLGHWWAGCDASLAAPHSDSASFLAPFLLLYSREADVYVRAGAELRSEVAWTMETGRDAPTHEWRYRVRFGGMAPRLRGELLSKAVGGVHFKTGRARTDIGYVFRRGGPLGSVSVRVTTDLVSRNVFRPAVKVGLARVLTPFARARLLLRGGDRPLSLRGELSVDLGRMPVTAAVEVGDELTLWAGTRIAGVSFSMPVWSADWRRLSADDALAGLMALLSAVGLLFWARKEHRRKEEGRRTEFARAFQVKLQQDAVLSERESAEGVGFAVLFAAVGRESLLRSPRPWPAESFTSQQVVEVTVTCNFYCDEKGLDLPADKSSLLGYLRPLSDGAEQLRLLIVYRKKNALTQDTLSQAFYAENERVLLFP